jgi:hypothetical protein
MSQYSHADLFADAILPAREKTHNGRKQLFCWATVCPERLGQRIDGWVRLEAGYGFSKGVFIKTRRSAARQRRSLTPLDFIAERDPREAHRARDHAPFEGLVLESDALPIVIRCARCGRTSKIMPARNSS